MKVFYRISDKGNPKEKLPSADKFHCLQNAISEFGAANIFVIADNCKPETITFIESKGLAYEQTSLGNSASFRYMVEKIISSLSDDESVYLLEDDYIHLPGAALLLSEGLSLADYITLYDHPDKYRLALDGGNPFNFTRLHPATVFVTAHSHWATVNSTTMTFATRVKTLREDYPVWKKYTTSRNPKDFRAFLELGQKNPSDALAFLLRGKRNQAFQIFKNWITRKKTRNVLCSIPACATHAETAFLAPVVDWREF